MKTIKEQVAVQTSLFRVDPQLIIIGQMISSDHQRTTVSGEQRMGNGLNRVCSYSPTLPRIGNDIASRRQDIFCTVDGDEKAKMKLPSGGGWNPAFPGSALASQSNSAPVSAIFAHRFCLLLHTASTRL